MCVGDFMVQNNKLKPKKEYIIIFILTIIGNFLDQITKFLINFEFNFSSCVNCLPELLIKGGTYHGFNIVPGKGIEIIKDFFYITNVRNTGAAWGIFSGNVMILAIVSIVVVLVLINFLRNEKNLNKLSIIYYSMLFSGTIGNLIDRLFNGYVTDFFNFYILEYDYPVFNVADILIVSGMLLMVIDVVRGEIHVFKERKRKLKN